VPAAAVIPAPRAYTDIAAVKTLVVGCRVQVCQVATRGAPARRPTRGRKGGSVPSGTQPLAVCSCARIIIHDGENCSCSKPPSVEAEAVFTPDACVRPLTGSRARPVNHSLGPPLESTIAATLENSVCSTHPLGWMPVHGMAKHRPDVAVRCCAGLGAQSGELGAHRPTAQCGIPSWSLPPPGLRGGCVPSVREGTAWGERYCSARGEILRPL